MSVNLAQKYSDKMDLVVSHGSYTERFVNKDYEFDGVKTINVYTPTTVALSDYDRTATGDRFGGNNELQDTIATYTLANDKTFKIAIDAGNYKQGAFAKKAGAVLQAELNEQYIPEVDKNRFAKALAAAKANSQTVAYTETLGAYTSVLNAQAFLDEGQAPVADRVMFTTPSFYNLVKGDITTGIHANGYNDKLLPRGFVGELDGMSVVKVPSSYFPANTSAIIWQKKALLGANQIKKTVIKTDSELVDGAVIYGRFIFDAFVLEAKKKAVSAIVTSASK